MSRVAIIIAAVAALALTGCGATEAAAPAAQQVDPQATAVPTSAAPAATLTVRDPWVKAADTGMTAAFGTLVNNTGADVTVASASSPASPIELHTMSMKDGKMVMEPKGGGFVIKAGATHELMPGGDHLMLLKPAAPVRPGDELTFTLKLSSGDSVTFTAVAKPFAGAEESYEPGTHS